MLIDLLSIYVIVWIIKTAVEDTAHAVKGTTNPRYELRRQKALAAGRPAPTQPRYGSRDWFGDLASDALAAQTERRRQKTAEKANAKSKAGKTQEATAPGRPVDDMVDQVGVRTPSAKGVGDTPARPTFRTDGAGGHDDPLQRLADDLAARRANQGGFGPTNCGHCGTEVRVGSLHPRVIDGQEKQVCAHCAGLIKVDASLLEPVPAGETVDGPVFVLTDDGQTAQSVPSPGAATNGNRIAERRPSNGVPANVSGAKVAANGHGGRVNAALLSGERCTRPLCPGGRIVARRPWPGQPNPHLHADPSLQDIRCETCGWLSTYLPEGLCGGCKAVPPTPTTGNEPGPTVDLDQIRRDMDSGIGQCLGCGEMKPLVAKYWAVAGEVCADCASKVNPKDLRALDDAPLAVVIPLFNTPNKEDIMPTVNGEVTGLDPAISYANALAHFAGEHGQAGNEGYIGFLTESKVTGTGLSSATDMQEAFANAQAAAERHAAELAKQKTVQEAYDQNPDAGTKDFLTAGR